MQYTANIINRKNNVANRKKSFKRRIAFSGSRTILKRSRNDDAEGDAKAAKQNGSKKTQVRYRVEG